MLTKRYGLAGLCLLLVGLVVMALWGSMSSNAKTPSGSGPGQLVGAQDAAPADSGAYGSYGSYGGASASPSGGGRSSGASADGGQAGGALTVRNDAKLGMVVTDGQGFTLYRFDKDTAKPPMSNCNDGCAKTWPPVTKEGTTAGSGIDASMIGEVTRADGSKQLTLGGWPVYRYAQDTAAGDTKGQGVGGTWFALAPDGKKAAAAATGASTYPSEMPTSAAPKPQPAQPAPGGAQVSVTAQSQLGSIVVDARGMTLYQYAKDPSWPMRSLCEGQCAMTWKPAPAVDPSQVKGVDPKLIGKMQRSDGTWQLSINCKPVYTYAGDNAPGDANGNGKDNLWSAINPAGKPVTGK
ncbi:SCO0930 family lipoprotein [Kitasatospora aureofaciens]|uniref:SCO0930 family lipoprotein n=1 Tax=Kitasatospora aureofaciens TaxID=1894 RepID=UPI00210D35C0|nr:SCO0930 family lipoprotein [Kitasatospora aureofaciens]